MGLGGHMTDRDRKELAEVSATVLDSRLNELQRAGAYDSYHHRSRDGGFGSGSGIAQYKRFGENLRHDPAWTQRPGTGLAGPSVENEPEGCAIPGA